MNCQMQGGQKAPPNYGVISYRAEPLVRVNQEKREWSQEKEAAEKKVGYHPEPLSAL